MTSSPFTKEVSLASKRVLCVDDDADNCLMMSVLLGFAGFRAATARSIEEGVRLALKGHFDLYLLDLWFEGGGGEFELCRRLRAFDRVTPIIIFTADARPAVRRRARDYEVDAFLVKPDGLDVIVETIDALTRRPAGCLL